MNSPVASSRYGGVRLPGAVVFQGALLLAGCAALRPAAPPVVPAPSAVGASVWEQRVGVLQSLPDWELQGRAAVAYGKQGWQASLTFTQSGDVSDVHLAGPLGIAASELTLMPAGLSVNGAPPTADVVNRLQAKLGFALPLEDLRYWLLGVPAPDAPADVTRNASDRAAQLSQAGWTVVFDRYMPNQGDVLPARLVLSHEDVRIRIVVEQWKLPAGARMTDGKAAAGERAAGERAAGGAVPAWPAPAKLNLFLHILGRRADGYHELQTCFQFIDLCDEIVIRPRTDGRIRRQGGAAGVAESADLVVRAAMALKDLSGCPLGADLEVHKRIPMGAGLGGGSSDAATTLLALNRLWQLNFSVDRLAEIGLRLGADVPVFVRGRVAWGEGVGERLTPLSGALAPPETVYLILKPPVSVATAAVFQDPELTRNSAPITIAGFLSSGGRNDCEPIVRRRHPEVGRALDWLAQFGRARLTGTGACVFVDCGTMARGRDVLRRVPPEFEAYLARGLNDSPVLERVAAG